MKRHFLALALASALVSPLSYAQAPHEQSHNSWVSISGQITNPTEEGFTLNYGEGQIRVDMNDADWYAPQGPFQEGATVSVYGEVNQADSAAEIVANSVFVESEGRLFTRTDTVFGKPEIIPVVPVRVGAFTYTGEVGKVQDDRFTIDTGRRELMVDVSAMKDNPLDEQGAMRIEQGDTVMVYGVLDAELGRSRTVTADSIITIDEGARNES
ncbi:hypothetical protein SAMN05216421_0925 [Halopseudomonas xinjiangensis]|uniref:OB fold (BOF) protein n=1 Tax=Halopseudomonas xinjiangensis TaxID=487184 RepID=A0A1H1PII6_9GAMM|nr:OB-fold nucleic acid binding domain-containing protein [Halopseudomonas xinjiangensis]SDS11056.1 hypothetical protein SAMN05216421_0925 [Halopseudomonas xinjiangensis]